MGSGPGRCYTGFMHPPSFKPALAFKKWLAAFKKALSQKNEVDLAALVERFKADAGLHEHSLADGGPLGKAGRLGSLWAVEWLLKNGECVTSAVLQEVWTGKATKPSYVSESASQWNERFERKRMATLEKMAASLREGSPLKEEMCQRIIEHWAEGEWSPEVVRKSAELASRLISHQHDPLEYIGLEDALAWQEGGACPSADYTIDRHGSRTLLHWAFLTKNPVALLALVDQGHDPMALDTGSANPGWSLMGTLDGSAPLRPSQKGCDTRKQELDEQCWSWPTWGEVQARLKCIKLETRWEVPKTAPSAKPRI